MAIDLDDLFEGYDSEDGKEKIVEGEDIIAELWPEDIPEKK